MKRSELTEFAVEEEGFKLKIRRGSNGYPVVSQSKGSNSPFAPGEAGLPPPASAPQIPMTSSPSTPPSPRRKRG